MELQNRRPIIHPAAENDSARRWNEPTGWCPQTSAGRRIRSGGRERSKGKKGSPNKHNYHQPIRPPHRNYPINVPLSSNISFSSSIKPFCFGASLQELCHPQGFPKLPRTTIFKETSREKIALHLPMTVGGHGRPGSPSCVHLSGLARLHPAGIVVEFDRRSSSYCAANNTEAKNTQVKLFPRLPQGRRRSIHRGSARA